MSHEITKGDITLSLADDRGRKKQLTISRDSKVLTAVRYDPLSVQEQLDVLVKLEVYDKERDWMADLNELAARIGQNGSGGALGPIVTTLNTVEREEVDWLWFGRLARGKPTCLMGDPGVGKSFVTAAIATAVSLGIPLPGEEESREPADVLFLACEDGLADTMVPRLEDMGADMARIHVMTGVTDLDGKERHPSLVDDLPAIERALTGHHCRLLIIDPINAYLGSQLDTHRDAALRGALAPLSSLCERLGIACIFVMHLTKSGRDKAIYRAQGSIAYIGVSRVTLLAGANAENPDDRAIIWVKGNNSEPMPSVGYEIKAGGVFGWIPGESSLTTEQCLAPEAGMEAASKVEEAEAFLSEALADGPRLARETITEAMTELGISAKTVKTAKSRLGVRSIKRGFGAESEWLWELAEAKGAKDAQLGNLTPLGDSVSEDGNEGGEDYPLSVANAASPEAAERTKLLELLETQGWPQFVKYQHPSGRLEGLHMGQEHHWRGWAEEAEPAVLSAVVEALGETS